MGYFFRAISPFFPVVELLGLSFLLLWALLFSVSNWVGGGHGGNAVYAFVFLAPFTLTYVFVGEGIQPWSGLVKLAFVGLAFWPLVVMLFLARRLDARFVWATSGALLVHYCGAAAVLALTGDKFGGCEPESCLVGFITPYLIANVWIWIALIVTKRAGKDR